MLRTQFVNAQFRDGSFTDQNQLASALLVKPVIADFLAYAFGNEGDGKAYGVLQFLTQGTGRVGKPDSSYKIYGNDEIMWPLMGYDTRAIPIVAASTPPPNAQVGINFSTFIVPMAEKYFSLGDVCRFADGSLGRVQEEPYRAGNAWCYTYQLMTGDPLAFVAPFALQAGKEVAWSHTAFEEGSEGGGMKEATPMWFKNQMHIQRMGFGMTGGAKTDVVIFKFETNKGRSDLWMYKKQMDVMRQWNKAQERAFWFNRYNRLADGTIPNIGANGRVVKTGSGIEEQITGANTFVTARLSEELLKHMLLDIMDCGKGAENVKRMLITGKGGIYEFDLAMKRALGGLGGFVVDTTFIHKLTGNTLGFGSQFTTYKGLLGSEFTVVHHPMFDDKTIFTELDPVTGFTRQSYNMYFLDFSDYGGEPNIQMAAKGAGGESRKLLQWFTAGATTADFDGDTGVKKLMRSNGFDGFYCYMLSETMITIRNPLSCGVIKIQRP